MQPNDRTPDEKLRQIAARQHGLATSAQALDAGLSSQSIRHRVHRGDWTRLTPTILRLCGSPATDDQRCMAAVLGGGVSAVLSHSTAAAVWGIPGFPLDELHVSRRRAATSRTPRSQTIHEPRSLPDHHTTMLRDLPLTNPTRTVFDLAGVLSPARVERALDTAWSRRLVTGRSLHEMLPELAERGRTGIGVMRQLLADRPPDYNPADSGTELRARQLLTEAGIEGFELQVDLGDEVEWIGRVDLVHRQLRIVIEIDSALYHDALIDRRADAQRTRRLEAAGYLVRSTTDLVVWYKPGAFVSLVRDARREARRRRPRTKRKKP